MHHKPLFLNFYPNKGFDGYLIYFSTTGENQNISPIQDKRPNSKPCGLSYHDFGQNETKTTKLTLIKRNAILPTWKRTEIFFLAMASNNIVRVKASNSQFGYKHHTSYRSLFLLHARVCCNGIMSYLHYP